MEGQITIDLHEYEKSKAALKAVNDGHIYKIITHSDYNYYETEYKSISKSDFESEVLKSRDSLLEDNKKIRENFSKTLRDVEEEKESEIKKLKEHLEIMKLTIEEKDKMSLLCFLKYKIKNLF